MAVGAPQGLSLTVTDGIVSAVRVNDGRRLLQLSAPISPGSSGGAVINEQGEVIGVVKGQLTKGQNLNFAVPAADVVKLLAKYRAQPDTGAPIRSDEDIQLASGLAVRATAAYEAGRYDEAIRLWEQLRGTGIAPFDVSASIAEASYKHGLRTQNCSAIDTSYRLLTQLPQSPAWDPAPVPQEHRLYEVLINRVFRERLSLLDC